MSLYGIHVHVHIHVCTCIVSKIDSKLLLLATSATVLRPTKVFAKEAISLITAKLANFPPQKINTYVYCCIHAGSETTACGSTSAERAGTPCPPTPAAEGGQEGGGVNQGKGTEGPRESAGQLHVQVCRLLTGP